MSQKFHTLRTVRASSARTIVNVAETDMTPKLKRPAPRYIPKELSWLSFNERVLQEAGDDGVPPVQRLRFLGIFSNNMDEFFRVRVADVRRLATFAKGADQEHYKNLLEQIQQRVMELQRRFDQTYLEVLNELRRNAIFLVSETQLEPHQAAFAADYFQRVVQPELEPILLDDNHPLPVLNDTSIYLAIKLRNEQQIRYALLEVPTERLNRFVEIPTREGQKGNVFIVLENIIRHSLPQVFRGVFPIDEASAYTIKLTRDAELELDEGITQSLIDKVSSSLKRRRRADPVRFVYDQAMPEDLRLYLNKRFSLGRYDSLIAGARYHNSKDFISFPRLAAPSLEYRPLGEIPAPELDCADNIFLCLRQRDVLLHYPYQSFSHITNMLQTAAIDPAVREIKISLYRVAKHSHVIDALLNAVRNHKQVTAVVELQARFDEEANISWARRLTDGGVNVIFGIPGLKVHSKLILISRQEGNQLRHYSHIGTGNFNEKTSTIYTDFSLLTYNQEIGQDVANVFDFIQYTYRRHRFRHLMVSPHSNRSGFTSLINDEIAAARAGDRALITIKCNNLVDERIIGKLYEASQAGVEVRLIVRGMCSLVAGVEGLSDNIRVISIVDRFLEHPRVMIFHNRGNPRYFISSADLMTRNLDFRVEVSCPIHDPALQQRLQDIIDIQWNDNVKARVVDEKQQNRLQQRPGTRVRSQEAIYRYLRSGRLPAALRRRRRTPAG